MDLIRLTSFVFLLFLGLKSHIRLTLSHSVPGTSSSRSSTNTASACLCVCVCVCVCKAECMHVNCVYGKGGVSHRHLQCRVYRRKSLRDENLLQVHTMD